MRRFRSVVVLLLAGGVAVVLIFAATLYASAWYFRWRAEQGLEAVKNVRPGVTTEAEYMTAVKSVQRHSEAIYSDGAIVGAFAIGNRPHWYLHVPAAIGNRIEGRLVVLPVVFSVVPSFVDGRVTKLEVREMSIVAGHSAGAGVTLLAEAYAPHDIYPYDGDFSGSAVDDAENHEQVFLDERASEYDVRHALALQFHCFTDFHFCGAPSDFR